MTQKNVVSFTREHSKRYGVFVVRDSKGYRFIDKDPVIDLFREAVRRSGLKVSQIAKQSRVTPTTLHSWLGGKTRRPQHATLRAALNACGYNEQFINTTTGHMLRFSQR